MNLDLRQAALFEAPTALATGLLYEPEFLAAAEERALLAVISQLPLREAKFRDYFARRRVAHFHSDDDPARYDDDDAEVLATGPLPPFLAELRARVAGRLGIPERDFVHALVSEYRPGTPIGWHRDKPVYGVVAGVSLAGWGRMRFRPFDAPDTRHTLTLDVAPRSLYVMRDDIRWRWQHSMQPTRELRYSITLRTRASVR